MASLDSVSITILLGAVLVMAGILSSLLALRFGAPLLLVFLFIGMLAGDSGPGQLQFDDVRSTYLVGSVALVSVEPPATLGAAFVAEHPGAPVSFKRKRGRHVSEGKALAEKLERGDE